MYAQWKLSIENETNNATFLYAIYAQVRGVEGEQKDASVKERERYEGERERERERERREHDGKEWKNIVNFTKMMEYNT